MRFDPENVQPRCIVDCPVLAGTFLAGLLLSKQGAAAHDSHPASLLEASRGAEPRLGPSGVWQHSSSSGLLHTWESRGHHVVANMICSSQTGSDLQASLNMPGDVHSLNLFAQIKAFKDERIPIDHSSRF